MKYSIATLFMLIFSWTLAQETKYFTNLRGIISPYLSYEPRCEIDSSQSKFINHYQVDYLTNDTISEIRYYKRGLPNDGAYFGTHKVKIVYHKNHMVRTYFNQNDNPSNMWRHYYAGGEIHKEVFELDNLGKKRSLKLYDTDDDRIVTGSGIYQFEWSPISKFSFVQYQFDQEGNQLPLTSYFPLSVTRISIDERGYLKTIENLNPETLELEVNSQTGYAKVIFDFDEYGNEMGWSFTDDKDHLAERKEVEGTDYGYASWKYSFNWSDRSLGLYKGFIEMYFDSEQSRVSNNYGIYKVVYHKNGYGDFTEIQYYQHPDDKLLNHPIYGYAILRIEYDDNGRLVKEVLIDQNGKVLEN